MPVVAVALALTAALVPFVDAGHRAGMREPRRPAQASKGDHHVICDKGISLALTSSAVPQGSLILARLSAKAPIISGRAEWDSRDVPLWPQSQDGRTWVGLLGVDLEKAPGQYQAKITGQATGAEAFSCIVPVLVRAGTFPTENLKVQKQFVEPDPEQVARARAETQKLRAIFGTITPERLWQGAFRVPLDGVTTGGNFGRRRVLNGQPGSPHSGIDFPAPTGTPIHAAQAGRVVLAEPLFFSGNTVVVDHGFGIYTFYGHLSTFSVHAGDTVKAGAELGKVGATGRVTGPHLHWGLTVDRERVNALQIVKLLGIR